MSEHTLWNRIRESIGHKGHFVRIEFNPTAGTPDVNYCVAGCEGWIELKHISKKPGRAGTPVFGRKGLRDEQVSWIRRRLKNQGRAFVCAQVGRVILLHEGRYAREYNSMPWSVLLQTNCLVNEERERLSWDRFIALLKQE